MLFFAMPTHQQIAPGLYGDVGTPLSSGLVPLLHLTFVSNTAFCGTKNDNMVLFHEIDEANATPISIVHTLDMSSVDSTEIKVMQRLSDTNRIWILSAIFTTHQ
jgi:hypothetical protein